MSDSSFKGTSWLVAKWLAAGMSTGFLGMGVAQGVQQLADEPSVRSAPQALSAPTSAPVQPNLSSALAAPENATSPAEAEPSAAIPSPATVSATTVTIAPV